MVKWQRQDANSGPKAKSPSATLPVWCVIAKVKEGKNQSGECLFPLPDFLWKPSCPERSLLHLQNEVKNSGSLFNAPKDFLQVSLLRGTGHRVGLHYLCHCCPVFLFLSSPGHQQQQWKQCFPQSSTVWVRAMWLGGGRLWNTRSWRLPSGFAARPPHLEGPGKVKDRGEGSLLTSDIQSGEHFQMLRNNAVIDDFFQVFMFVIIL